MAKFCKEIKDDEGLKDNMADAKSIRNDIKDINEQIKIKIQQHKDNQVITEQKEKRIATMLTTFLLSTKKK